MTRLSLVVNGKSVAAEVEPRTSLADFLRLEQRLTGTHLGCEHGVCGACTVLIDNVPARSCIAFAVTLEGKEVRTIEGFEDDPVMARLRQAFHEEHALQCGFCTSGMLISGRDIVTRLAAADETRIRAELAGNLCRCTGYMGIVNALLRVMREMPAETRLARASPQPAPAPSAAAPFKAFAATPQTPRQGRASHPPPYPPPQGGRDGGGFPMASPSPSKGEGGEGVTLGIGRADASAPWGLPPESGWSRITEQFTIAAGPREVWRLLGDVPRLARAMPGAELDGADGGRLAGRMRVAFGPIKARFAGTATLQRDEERMSGLLEGGGSDARGGSRAKGRVAYRLLPGDGGTTRVELALDYQLQGPLAQFARAGLVKDFAGRLIAEFARNLEAGLSRTATAPGEAAAPAAPLKAGSLFWAVLWARLKRFLGFSG